MPTFQEYLEAEKMYLQDAADRDERFHRIFMENRRYNDKVFLITMVVAGVFILLLIVLLLLR